VSSKWVLSLRFPHYNPVCTSPLPIHATCPTHLLIDFITRLILGEEYISLSSSWSSLLYSPVTSSLLDPNMLLCTLFSHTLSPTFLPQCKLPSFTTTQNNRPNYTSVYLNLYIFG
jgi:hypothetical protein